MRNRVLCIVILFIDKMKVLQLKVQLKADIEIEERVLFASHRGWLEFWGDDKAHA